MEEVVRIELGFDLREAHVVIAVGSADMILAFIHGHVQITAARRVGMRHRHDVDAARALFEECLTLQHDNGNKQGVIEAVAGLAGLAVDIDQFTRAAQLFGAVEVLIETMGAPLAPADWMEWECDVAQLRAGLDEPSVADQWGAGQALSLEEAVVLALS